MRVVDQQRIAEWIGDAFAILCVRTNGRSAAEDNLRRGFESILRQLGTPPLRVVVQAQFPAHRPTPASITDLKHIIKALDSCLSSLARYEAILTTAQRRIQ
jgi:hypothetical protein